MDIAEKTLQLKQDFDEVYEAGKIAQDEAFWKEYQKGFSLNYANGCFAGFYWTDKTFKPKYDICPKEAAYMFFFNNVQDLDTAIKNAGIKLDLSQCTAMNSLFQNYLGKIVPEISTIGISALTLMFGYASSLTTIKKLILKENGSQSFAETFSNCSSLKNIIIEGVIGRNINFSVCPLTKESILSVVEHLSDSETGRTVTFKKTAKESAFTMDEWATLIATKPNWTFSLA